MAKIPETKKRNPSSQHVKDWMAYKRRKGRPKAALFPLKWRPLTLERYIALMRHYESEVQNVSWQKTLKAADQRRRIISLKESAKTPEEVANFTEALRRTSLVIGATVTDPVVGYNITREIIRDFGRVKGLRVFGFGLGYAQLLFFLKKYVGAKTKGVDLGNFSQEFTRREKLGVEHGKSVDDPSLRRHGKFDVTYSINVLEWDVINRKTALGMLDNLSHMTRKGGRSYHVISISDTPLREEEITKSGFRIDGWQDIAGRWTFVKLTKIRD